MATVNSLYQRFTAACDKADTFLDRIEAVREKAKSTEVTEALETKYAEAYQRASELRDELIETIEGEFESFAQDHADFWEDK
jgi:hypothetical protein